MSIPFKQLNIKQKKVIKTKDETLLVLAGPGTGKTEVLTHRILHLVSAGVDLEKILAVTFSRKAANEMAERLCNSLEVERDLMNVSTLHAEALRQLTETGHKRKFLLGNDETRQIIKDAAEDVGYDEGWAAMRSLEINIRLSKAQNELPSEITDGDFKQAYMRYEELLEFNKAIDLDGLVMRIVRTISQNPGHSLNINQIHLLVDEYQDINQAEYQFIQLLSENAESLFVVGDDDQSIYGWRGANPDIIRNFEEDFPECKVEILEESHRCSGNILEGAYAIVSRDPECIKKPLCSSKGDGSPIIILISKSWTVEVFWIVDWLKKYLSKNSTKPSDVAVLVKTLNLAEFLAEQLRIAKIPAVYWRSGGFLSDKNVLDILAHIRLIADKEDNLALRRCLKTITGYGIGYSAERELRYLAERNKCSLWDVMRNFTRFNTLRRWRTSIKNFVATIDKMEEEITDELDIIVNLIARRMKTDQLSSVKKLRDFSKTLPENTDLDDFLTELHRNRGLDLAGGGPEPGTEEDAIAIMSMHSAKGLGFKVVFILGMDYGLMPDPNQDINEQRRLCYVAMTRAKDKLFLCHSKLRKGPASRGHSFYNPSSFLRQIPAKNRKIIQAR